MFRNIAYLALVNLRRKVRAAVFLFLTACFCSSALFLAGIVRNFLGLPDFGGVKIIFHTITLSSLTLNAAALAVLSLFQLSTRKAEYAILRMGGVKKADIILLSSLEIIYTAFAGALFGVIIVMGLILAGVLYLPYFFKGLQAASVLRLIGTGGQAVFAVIIIELGVSVPFLASMLKEDISRLLRGPS